MSTKPDDRIYIGIPVLKDNDPCSLAHANTNTFFDYDLYNNIYVKLFKGLFDQK